MFISSDMRSHIGHELAMDQGQAERRSPFDISGCTHALGLTSRGSSVTLGGTGHAEPQPSPEEHDGDVSILRVTRKSHQSANPTIQSLCCAINLTT
eukprot:222748-Amphidinium_carterae.1